MMSLVILLNLKLILFWLSSCIALVSFGFKFCWCVCRHVNLCYSSYFYYFIYLWSCFITQKSTYISTPQGLVVIIFRLDIFFVFFFSKRRNAFSYSRWAEWPYLAATVTEIETSHLIGAWELRWQRDKPTLQSSTGHHQIPDIPNFNLKK